MKPLLIAAALLLVPAAAQAQVAAATVPNSFDRPAARAQQPVPALPTAAPAPAMSTTPANARSEEVLRDIIAGGQAGTLPYALMTDDLAGKIRAQEGGILPILQGFGAIQAFDFVGSEESTDLFAVTFATAATQWMIGFNDGGKVNALLFRPAPEPSTGDRSALVPGDRSVISNPQWLILPAPAFPAAARANGVTTGRVELTCRPLKDGTLVECEVRSETPQGQGFAQEALNAASHARIEPQDFYTSESRLNFAVAFRP